MTAVYYANVKFDTNTAAVVAEMIEDGFAPDVAEWLALFIPSIPGELVGRRLKLVIDDASDAFTVEEIKKSCSASLSSRAALSRCIETVATAPPLRLMTNGFTRSTKTAKPWNFSKRVNRDASPETTTRRLREPAPEAALNKLRAWTIRKFDEAARRDGARESSAIRTTEPTANRLSRR